MRSRVELAVLDVAQNGSGAGYNGSEPSGIFFPLSLQLFSRFWDMNFLTSFSRICYFIGRFVCFKILQLDVLDYYFSSGVF